MRPAINSFNDSTWTSWYLVERNAQHWLARTSKPDRNRIQRNPDSLGNPFETFLSCIGSRLNYHLVRTLVYIAGCQISTCRGKHQLLSPAGELSKRVVGWRCSLEVADATFTEAQTFERHALDVRCLVQPGLGQQDHQPTCTVSSNAGETRGDAVNLCHDVVVRLAPSGMERLADLVVTTQRTGSRAGRLVDARHEHSCRKQKACARSLAQFIPHHVEVTSIGGRGNRPPNRTPLTLSGSL
jgi:hypothetical protein